MMRSLSIFTGPQANSVQTDFMEFLKAKFLYDPQDIQSLVLLGAWHFVKIRDCDQAIQYLRKAIYYAPKNVEARFWLGVCFYHWFSDYNRAEKILSEALALDRQRADCLSLMAYINWDRKGPLKRSLSYLKEALQISPEWPLLKVETIYLLIQLGGFKEAGQEIEQAQQLLKQPVKISGNAVEEYYETTITGRGWTNLPERLVQLKRCLSASRSL